MSFLETEKLSHSEPVNRKPRIAIMGEFSAGKSTLSNLLLGASPLPVMVTATQLPPVWMAFGDQAPFREDLEGNIHPVDLENLQAIPLNETGVVRIFLKAELLENCDLIDMPGISDPNMSPDIWERVIHNADSVLWCTHATQAWRQSEAAVWKSLPEELRRQSFLLITRFDKLLTERDQQKVLKRVGRETSELFADTFPISLTQALAAEDNQELWDKCGAGRFEQELFSLLDRIAGSVDKAERPTLMSRPEPMQPQSVSKPAIAPEATVVNFDEVAPKPVAAPVGVMPTRVRPVVSAERSASRPTVRP